MSSSQTTLSPTRPPIVAEALVRHFGSGDDLVRAVDGVDLQVEAGEIFGFLGPNGAGKSTTVRMLTTLLRPTSGKATVAGFDVVQQADQVRRSIGVALQDAAIDPLMTGAELLQLQAVLYGLPKSIHAARAGELLERVGLTGAADRRVGTYSGGMRRRLDLAMSLIHEPSVLFLDEPTTGLDPMSRISLWEEIRRLNVDGTTVLLTTQYLEEADQLADRIAIIDHGLIVRQGEPAALKRELGDPTLFVHVAPEHTEAAKGLIAEFGEPRPSPDGTLGVSVAGGSRSVSAVVRRLDEAGIAVDSLDLREPSLDDVFAQATGYRLEGAEAGSGGSNFPEADIGFEAAIAVAKPSRWRRWGRK
jgi:ABC-2 type transport system ATP-binding protein